MKSMYDFQTEQIHKQHAHVMGAHAAWIVRNQTIRVSYEAGHISYDEFKEKMVKSRTEMFRQEKISCLNYKIAIWTFERDMYVDHPETYVAPKE